MIFITPNGILSQGTNLEHGVLGYHNVIVASEISASSEEFPNLAVNLANPITSLVWTPASADPVTITVALTGDDGIDYIGLARHNLGTARINLKIESEIEEDEFETLAEILPADDRAIMVLFGQHAPLSLRLTFTPLNSVRPIVSVIRAGLRFTLQRKIYVGHTPIVFGREDEILNGKSMNGQYLGRVMLGEFLSTSVALTNLTSDWYRTHFEKFVKDVRTDAFFYAWRPQDFPEEVAYGWLASTPRPRNEGSNGMMAVSFDVEAIA